ncbi:hypothetical protein KIF53_20895 [Chromobacterium subtsugae]|uniref:Uncharacterized protein n=1 Tax=Chromobacterium subtsugae TaxID=251747 RepID=A0ABS7FJ48_9NEIS|nr:MULTISPECIES: hypothetical protein [Chromobacterium]MBW7568474.1 hypothetical protein [Chromobacterium subtsugae]MBW8290103.1 hypothetical protein [Chromobacterium subtsugae]WSE89607.1 hypothetical protein U6115_11985 [Chromobacterium subtsugae]WVH57978.1 hypothetical protein U6151_12005 [Chromobacterium subtsugae]
MRTELLQLLEKLVEKVGEESATSILKKEMNVEVHELTIISNLSHHHIPDFYLRGDVFVASEGNVDLFGSDVIELSLARILLKVKDKLMERSWKRIYFIPTGHPIISLQIKLLIYQVTRLNSIDLLYLDGNFVDVDMNIRELELVVANKGKRRKMS